MNGSGTPCSRRRTFPTRAARDRAGGGLLVAGCGLFDEEKPEIRFYGGEWQSLAVNNSIAQFIIEHGYGYPTETVVLTTFDMQEALPSGEVDVALEGWQQNIPQWYQEQIASGAIVNLGPRTRRPSRPS